MLSAGIERVKKNLGEITLPIAATVMMMTTTTTARRRCLAVPPPPEFSEAARPSRGRREETHVRNRVCMYRLYRSPVNWPWLRPI